MSYYFPYFWSFMTLFLNLTCEIINICFFLNKFGNKKNFIILMRDIV